MQNDALIDIDWPRFDPRRVQAVSHRLVDHPLFQIDQLTALGVRLEQNGRIRSHRDNAAAGTPFNEAPKLHPNLKSAAETLADIEHAQAWMSLLNVQTDDIYRRLVDQVLDPLKPRLDRIDPGLCYRAGWIFITSPNAVTPFHMDKEHNFILQVRGEKTLYVWEANDTEAVSAAARDLFHDTHSRELIVWREELKRRAHVFHLKPGMGAYMPSTAPHLVENQNNGSITASFTYYTDMTRRVSLLHRLRHRLQQRGIRLPEVGQRPLQDWVLYRGCASALAVKEAIRRLLGATIESETERYAAHRFS